MDVGRWMSTNRLKLNTDKTELLWTGSRHSISQLHGYGPCIQLGADNVRFGCVKFVKKYSQSRRSHMFCIHWSKTKFNAQSSILTAVLADEIVNVIPAA